MDEVIVTQAQSQCNLIEEWSILIQWPNELLKPILANGLLLAHDSI